MTSNMLELWIRESLHIEQEENLRTASPYSNVAIDSTVKEPVVFA